MNIYFSITKLIPIRCVPTLVNLSSSQVRNPAIRFHTQWLQRQKSNNHFGFHTNCLLLTELHSSQEYDKMKTVTKSIPTLCHIHWLRYKTKTISKFLTTNAFLWYKLCLLLHNPIESAEKLITDVQNASILHKIDPPWSKFWKKFCELWPKYKTDQQNIYIRDHRDTTKNRQIHALRKSCTIRCRHKLANINSRR